MKSCFLAVRPFTAKEMRKRALECRKGDNLVLVSGPWMRLVLIRLADRVSKVAL
jgi:hypothetical protein